MSYENILYPLQDKFLGLLESLKTPFYLTGGTALSRFHFKHRYSDDLDFFVNDDAKFKEYISVIIEAVLKSGMKYIIEKRDESFCRLTIENMLKVDFVNDVPFYHGTVEQRTDGPFSRIDNPMNILANKITAFNDREEAKDISDIWIISKSLVVDWKEIFTAADSKAAGLSAPAIAKKLEEYDLRALKKVKWINRPADEDFKSDISRTIEHILMLG